MSSLSTGDKLLHFRILNKLGQGGMGEVYLAEDQKLGRRVAVKVLPASAAPNENARRRLIQEARSASALNHPNIVTIHSIEQLEGIDFIVMEYVEGETLSSRLQQGRLLLPALIDIHLQIAEGIAAAHDAGVIHRDIKSSNILITRNGRVKILDFGLAKLTTLLPEELPTGYQEQLTEEGTILGTVSYMSPEQIRGEVVDSRSDIFSFGCVLYESATGRLPFRGPNPTSVMYQITTAPIIPPSTLREDLPSRLDTILMKALAKDKAFRYSSARDLKTDLHSLSFPETMALSVTISKGASSKREESVVGRESELQKLQNDFHAVLEKSGKVIFLTGDPGSGKSYLAEEFLRRVSESYPGVLIERGRCVEHFGTGEAYLPFLDSIGSALKGPFREQVVQALRTYAPTWCMQFPGAFTSTGVLESSKKEAAAASKERMLREFSDALIELSSGAPLLLFFEDLHWADPSSADLLRYLSRRAKEHRIFILGTFRQEDLESGNPSMKACHLDLQAHSISEEIQMDWLTEAQVREYLDQMYSPNTFPNELSGMIYRKTEGHPLFTTSLAQFLTKQRVITKQENIWTVGRSLSDADLEMPENVKSMIRTKVEALTEEDRRILQYASIEGEEFTSSVLSDLLKMDEIDLEERLSKLERGHRLIRKTEEEDWPDGSLVTKYRFIHALYQNAFYADVVTKRRLQLHKSAGESLLKHHSGKADKIANRLASHFKLGRDFEKAVHFLTQAGDHAKNIYAHAEASQLYGDALQQLHELITKDPARWRQVAASLHENRADALAILGNQDEAKSDLLAAHELLEESDLLAQGRIHRKIAKAVETRRLMDEALKHYDHAQSLLQIDLESRPLEWQQEWLQINLDKTWLYYTQNLSDQMQELMAAIETYVERIGTLTQKLRFYLSSMLLANRLNRYRITDEVLELLERSRKVAEQTGVRGEIANVTFVTGFAWLWRGDLDRAERFLQQSLSEVLHIGDAVMQSRCLTYLTVLYRRRGNIEETRSYAERSLNLANQINMQEYVAAAKSNFGWLCWRSSQIADAKMLCEEALRIWQSLPLVSPFQELALWPLIAIALRENDVAGACKYAELMLHPSQRKLDPELELLLRAAIEKQSGELLQQATKIVEPEGYL